MTAETYIVDSGAVLRQAHKICIADSSVPPVLRVVQKIYVVDASAVLRQVFNSFTPVTTSYTTVGTGTITIPSYCQSMQIEVWGPNGTPGHGAGDIDANAAGGGGPGSGGYAYREFTIAYTNFGQTLNYNVADVDGTTTVSSGTFSLTTLTGPSGGDGADAPGPTHGGSAGSAGSTGTGGTTNSVGNVGTAGDTSSGGTHGAGVVGVNATGQSAGHGGYGSTNLGLIGGDPGQITVRFS